MYNQCTNTSTIHVHFQMHIPTRDIYPYTHVHTPSTTHSYTGAHRLLWRRLSPLPTKDLNTCVQRVVQLYERERGTLGMLGFPESDALVARVDRALARPGGALLLAARCVVCVGGC